MKRFRKYNTSWVLLTTLLIFTLSLTSYSIYAITSYGGNFTAVNHTVYTNWTHGSFNLTLNVEGLAVNITNTSGGTYIVSNYSQASRYSVNDYSNLTSSMYDLCFGTSDPKTMEFAIHNGSEYRNFTSNSTIDLESGFYEMIYIEPYMACPPGQYVGNITLKDATNNSENFNISLVIEIPVNPENTYKEADHTAFFRGSYALNNDTNTYYFWTNQSTNITSVTINLTNFTNNLDMFLFDNLTNNINSSVESALDDESIYYDLPSSMQLWQLRIFGNGSTDYVGNMYFSTLNVTNPFYNQSVSSINLGTILPQGYNYSEYGLMNQDESVLLGVNESIDIYHYRNWENLSGNYNSVLLFVPNFTQKLEVKIQWRTPVNENLTRWNLSLFNSAGALLGNSSSTYLYANKTNATLEESIIYRSFSGNSFWNITIANITNNTVRNGVYNLTAKLWINESEWKNSSFDQPFTINYTAGVNGTVNVTQNITLPENNSILDGAYRGSVTYSNNSGWQKKIPIDFSVKSGMLVINGTVERATVRVVDNVGFNRNGSQVRQMNISINNTGHLPVNYTTYQNFSYLRHLTNTSAYINYSIDSLPTNLMAGGTNDTIDISIDINTSRTLNAPGIYRGWVLFNATSPDNSSTESHPHNTFNLTIEVNLTDQVFIEINTISSTNGSIVYGNTVANYTNVTINFTVKLANGSVISQPGLIDIGNVSNISIRETNVTTYYQTLANFTRAHTSGVLCPSGGNCFANSTMPPNTKGGMFNLSIDLKWNTSHLDPNALGFNLTGRGDNNTLVVNNTGLHLVMYSGSSVTLDEGDEVGYVIVNVTNYGNLKASGRITMSDWTYATIESYASKINGTGSNCHGTRTSNYFDNTNIAGNGGSCWFQWKITSGSVDSDATTTSTVTPNDIHFGTVGSSLRVNYVAESSGNGDGDDTTEDTECSANSDCDDDQYCTSSGACADLSCEDTEKIDDHECVPMVFAFSITPEVDEISMMLETSNDTSIIVENTGDYTGVIELIVESDDGNITSEHTPDSCRLDEGEDCTFEITFNSTSEADIGDHTMKYNITVVNETDTFTKSFTLTILPTEEKKEEITQTYNSYVSTLESLLQQISELELTIDEENMTKVKLIYNQSNETLAAIKAAIDDEDYIEADSLIADLENDIERINAEILKLDTESVVNVQRASADMWFWVSIAVIIIVVAILVLYMLLPVKPLRRAGFSSGGGGFKPKGKKKQNPISGFMSKFKGRGEGYVDKTPKPKIQEAAPSKPVTIKPPKTAPKMAYGDFYKKLESGYDFKDKESKTPFSETLNRLKKKKKK